MLAWVVVAVDFIEASSEAMSGMFKPTLTLTPSLTE